MLVTRPILMSLLKGADQMTNKKFLHSRSPLYRLIHVLRYGPEVSQGQNISRETLSISCQLCHADPRGIKSKCTLDWSHNRFRLGCHAPPSIESCVGLLLCLGWRICQILPIYTNDAVADVASEFTCGMMVGPITRLKYRPAALDSGSSFSIVLCVPSLRPPPRDDPFASNHQCSTLR